MIKINLLGNNTAIDHSGKVMLVGYLTLVGFLFVMSIFLITSMNSQMAELELKEKTLRAQLESLESNTKEVSDLETKRKTLQNKLALIAQLKKNTSGPVRVMDDLNISLVDKLWLMELQEERSQIKIKGRALSNQEIANFINKLESSDFFDDVDLVDSQTVYYKKDTGQISATGDVSSFSQGTDSVGSGGRNIKTNKIISSTESSFQVSDDKTKGDIKIKEFIIAAKVNYMGKLVVQEAAETEAPKAPAPKAKEPGL